MSSEHANDLCFESAEHATAFVPVRPRTRKQVQSSAVVALLLPRPVRPSSNGRARMDLKTRHCASGSVRKGGHCGMPFCVGPRTVDGCMIPSARDCLYPATAGAAPHCMDALPDTTVILHFSRGCPPAGGAETSRPNGYDHIGIWSWHPQFCPATRETAMEAITPLPFVPHETGTLYLACLHRVRQP